MTTFIDFRYSRALATAMFVGQQKEEVSFKFAPGRTCYLVFEIKGPPSPLPLFKFVTAEKVEVGTVQFESDGALSLRCNGAFLLKTSPWKEGAKKDHFLGLRLGETLTGFRLGGTIQEEPKSLFPDKETLLSLELADESRVRVMGRGSGRAMAWAELFYHRCEPAGMCVELAMDWHHLRAGIPLFGMMTAEKLIEQGKLRLKFRSYAYEQTEAETTDFVRLFGSDEPADIAVHLAPPLYAQHTPDLPNLAFFVAESINVQADLVERCNRMDAISVPTRFTCDALRYSGVKQPIRVVPHGVDVDYFRPVSERKPLPGGRKFNFLAVSTHVERKNIRHLVRAFLEEFREKEEVTLFLLLRPEYHTSQNNVALDFTEWERRYEQDSAPIFLWTGYLTRENLRDFYANSNAYVMPSNEGFGLTLLEAMACGTPVIGLNYGGVLDFLNHNNGYLVSTGRTFISRDIDTLPYVGDRFYEPDIRHLRATMRHVFEHEVEARQRAALARRDCENQFTWTEVSRQFAELIEETYSRFVKKTTLSHRPAVSRASSDLFSWVLCVLDDSSAAKSLRYLKQRRDKATKVLFLFTRYARVKDVLHARRNGFIFYRWDGTLRNCRIIARSIFGRGWIGVLYPGETLEDDDNALRVFLASQPESVTEVSVTVGTGQWEGRFFRLCPPRENDRVVSCPEVRIRSSNPGSAIAIVK